MTSVLQYHVWTTPLNYRISDLQSKLDNFFSAQTPDWSKVDSTQQLTEAVAKARASVT